MVSQSLSDPLKGMLCRLFSVCIAVYNILMITMIELTAMKRKQTSAGPVRGHLRDQ